MQRSFRLLTCTASNFTGGSSGWHSLIFQSNYCCLQANIRTALHQMQRFLKSLFSTFSFLYGVQIAPQSTRIHCAPCGSSRGLPSKALGTEIFLCPVFILLKLLQEQMCECDRCCIPKSLVPAVGFALGTEKIHPCMFQMHC